ncbi:MAG: glycosyltransferase WbuB, partial [Clostridia bacterium]|nr:glycosyltransferase WbuB [Clostridia bacterium]
IPPEDPLALAAAIGNFMQQDAAELAEMGQKGADYVIANHEYTVLAQKFIDALSSATKGNDAT